jgi:hypothetical protein
LENESKELNERTQMIVEVDGIEEIRNIDRFERPVVLDTANDSPMFWINHPVLQENEMALRAFPDKVIIIKKWSKP